VCCGGPHGQFRQQIHHPRIIVLRANWRVLRWPSWTSSPTNHSLEYWALGVCLHFPPRDGVKLLRPEKALNLSAPRWRKTSPPRDGVKPLRPEKALNFSAPNLVRSGLGVLLSLRTPLRGCHQVSASCHFPLPSYVAIFHLKVPGPWPPGNLGAAPCVLAGTACGVSLPSRSSRSWHGR
jgi:hypothetical protein